MEQLAKNRAGVCQPSRGFEEYVIPKMTPCFYQIVAPEPREIMKLVYATVPAIIYFKASQKS